MESLQIWCEQYPELFVLGFDWASSGNTYKEDDAMWKELEGPMQEWKQAMADGDTKAAEACVTGKMAPILRPSSWFKNYQSKAQGTCAAACQAEGADGAKFLPCQSHLIHRFCSNSINVAGVVWPVVVVVFACCVQAFCVTPNHAAAGHCVAVCVDGGPVSRVEAAEMSRIVKNVHVYGMDTRVSVKCMSFAVLQQEVRRRCVHLLRVWRQVRLARHGAGFQHGDLDKRSPVGVRLVP